MFRFIKKFAKNVRRAVHAATADAPDAPAASMPPLVLGYRVYAREGRGKVRAGVHRCPLTSGGGEGFLDPSPPGRVRTQTCPTLRSRVLFVRKSAQMTTQSLSSIFDPDEATGKQEPGQSDSLVSSLFNSGTRNKNLRSNHCSRRIARRSSSLANTYSRTNCKCFRTKRVEKWEQAETWVVDSQISAEAGDASKCQALARQCSGVAASEPVE